MKILLVNQCFYPDVAATAQYSAELTAELAARGHEVTVIAGSRGYDNPALRFPARETWKGVRILRVPSLATGKGSKLKRALNIASFFGTCFWRMLTMPRFDVVIALTSPPLISVLAALFVKMKGGQFVFWIMDLNPDEAIAAGWLAADSLAAKVLEAALRYSAHTAHTVVALDRFMHARMAAKGIPAGRLRTVPPWSHDAEVRYDMAGRDAFRAQHGLAGKFVVMYAGNHSPVNPLDTILGAALRLATNDGVAFCFIGGGSEHARVRAFAATHGLKNVLCLPYIKPSEMAGPLSAADLQLVVLGNPMSGLIHPCKIYNVMTVGVPVMFVGPPESYVADIVRANPGLPVEILRHGDVDGAVRCIEEGARVAVPGAREDLKAVGRRFSMTEVLPGLAAMIEEAGSHS